MQEPLWHLTNFFSSYLTQGDLSRFGRDYLETGYYLETIFPLLNVRFIAVTDHYDNSRKADCDSLSVPVKNMVNAMYAKDHSRKQAVFYDMCKKTGRVRRNHVVYGYKYCDKTGRLVIDKELEMYVRMIFAWALHGATASQIADRLTFMGVPTRDDYKRGDGKRSRWSNSSIKYMIYNPVYAGIHTLGKTHESLYKGVQFTRIDRDEWLFFPDYHEAYISMDDYQLLNERIRKGETEWTQKREERKEYLQKYPNCFSQMVYCGTCRRKMSFLRGTHTEGEVGDTFQYYRCRYDKEHQNCGHEKVLQNYLKIVVMEQIQTLIQAICDKDKILKEIEAGGIKKSAMEQVRRKISRLKEKESLTDEKLLRAYMDHAEELLNDAEYQAIKEKFQKDKERAASARQDCEEKLEKMNEAVKDYHLYADKMKDALVDGRFNEELVKKLVSKIWVHDGGKRVEIEFKCNDIFANVYLDEILEGDGNDDNSTLS